MFITRSVLNLQLAISAHMYHVFYELLDPKMGHFSSEGSPGKAREIGPAECAEPLGASASRVYINNP